MRFRLVLLGCVVVASASGACLPAAGTPGMVAQARRPHALEPTLDELTHLDGIEGQRALLVVYPRSACSGSARMVIVDAAGTFFGSIGPGEAALLSVPSSSRSVIALSSVEVTAPLGVRSGFDEIALGASPSGIVFEAWRVSARQCGSGQYAEGSIATKAELETMLGEVEILWVEPRPAEGQAWLQANRKRMDEVLGRHRANAPAVVTRAHVP
jgi:hypothetical protein